MVSHSVVGVVIINSLYWVQTCGQLANRIIKPAFTIVNIPSRVFHHCREKSVNGLCFALRAGKRHANAVQTSWTP